MEVINYELGWKARLANDQFHTQFSVYYQTFDDYQANFAFDSLVPGLNNPELRNAETESTIWGVEFSGQARAGDFSLDFGLAYLESELGTFSSVIDPFRTAPDNVVNLSGAEVPFAPPFTGNIGLAYDIHMGEFT